MKIRLQRIALGTIGLLIAVLLAAPVLGQDEEPAVEKQDLGDGLWLVRNGEEPPTVYDTRSGRSMTMVDDQPALIDKRAGVMLIAGAEGPVLVDLESWWANGKDGGKILDDPERAEQMMDELAAMQFTKRQREEHLRRNPEEKRVEVYRKEDQRSDSSKSAASQADRYLELLGATKEEYELIILPLLLAVLEKQDEIRRSTIDPVRTGRRSRAVLLRDEDLPAPIRNLHRVLGAEKVEAEQLEVALEAFRVARRGQDEELQRRREKLREVLTVPQESALTAAGVLD